MKKPKAIIFDLDGTIANTLPLCVKAFRSAIEPFAKRPISDAEIIATFGPSEEGTIIALSPNNTKEGIAIYKETFQKLLLQNPTPFDGIIDILSMLKKHALKISMVTGKSNDGTDFTLQTFGIKKYFDFIETGIPSAPSKPIGLQKIMNAYSDLDKSEIYYVGDAPSDVLICREIGIPIVVAAWAETADLKALKDLQPPLLFEKVADFKTWLQQTLT